MDDESLHEIQLDGKQLVFLFMAATVVAVVVFLCGVMVGRGVPQRAGAAPAVLEQSAVDPTATIPPPLAVPSTGTAPLAAAETLTYPRRLSDSAPPADTLKPLAETVLAEPAPAPRPAAPVTTRAASAPKPAPVAVAPKPARAMPKPSIAATPKPAPTPVPLSTPAADVTPLRAESSESGFVVQVAAVRTRADAETIAERLSAKGYPAFITTAGANFRVRVGKFGDRKEAEAIAGRLQREERVRAPWITR
jgi:cell division protein FtsN